MNAGSSQTDVCPVCHQKTNQHRNRTVTLITYGVMSFLLLLVFLIVQTVRSVNNVALPQNPAMLLQIPDARVLASEGMRGGTSTSSLHNARNLTAEHFKKLQVGMTSEAVVKLLHYRGTATSRGAKGGKKSVSRHWQNPNGTNISALFENNRLVAKMQFGLLPEPTGKAAKSR